MLTLDLPVVPYWLDLPRGVRVEIRPVTTAVMAAAQAGSAHRLGALRAAEPELDPDMATSRRGRSMGNLGHRPAKLPLGADGGFSVALTYVIGQPVNWVLGRTSFASNRYQRAGCICIVRRRSRNKKAKLVSA